MIPAAITPIPAIPRNANGKTDTRHLPDPFTTTAGYPAPPGTTPSRDEVTNAVATIWAQTLQVDPRLITDHADFHQLGGNSILLLTMLNEISQTLIGHHHDFMDELTQIIRDPTLRHISDLARRARDSHRGS